MIQQQTFCFTHLTDPHVSSLVNVELSQLLNKRLLGYLSWRTKRRFYHLPSILNKLVDDMKTIKPDHVVISGDLTHIGLPDEFDQAANWLSTVGTPENVTVIPGNHETYVGSGWQSSFAKWQAYLASDDSSATCSPVEYPTLRIRQQIAFIGLNSAYPSAPFLATGKLGDQQLDGLQQSLEQTRQQNLFRVVIVHHPPIPGMTIWRKRLIDAKRLQQILQQSGAGLVLYGHTHKTDYRELDTASGILPLVSVSSASSSSGINIRRASYTVYRVHQLESGKWRLSKALRQYDPEQNKVVEKHHW